MKLSPNQDAIRLAPVHSHIKVTAAPGSGKSTVACHRMAYLINEIGINPKAILATMFNSDAVDEFIEGLDRLDILTPPPVRTYHTLAKKILESLAKQNVGDNIPLDPSPFAAKKILFEALKLTRETFPELNTFDNQLQETFDSFISSVKGGTQSPEDCFRENFEFESKGLITAYYHFERLRLEKGFRTFDDLIKDAVNLLMTNDIALNAVSNKFEVIIVDEYQDINEISHLLIKLIAGSRAKLMVVGDDDQTINEWRGAKPEYLISEFDKDFKDPMVFSLEETFRYGHTVSLMASALIKHNKVRINKRCISPHDSLDTVVEYKTYPVEADIPHYCHKQTAIIDGINKTISSGGSYSDVGILVRIYSLTPYIEMALLSHDIPYKLDGNKSVLNSPEYHSLNGLLCFAYFKEATLEQKTTWVDKALRLPRLPIKEAVYKELVKAISNNEGEVAVRKLCKSLGRYAYKQTVNRALAVLDAGKVECGCALEVIKRFTTKANFTQSLEMMKDTEKKSKVSALMDSYKALFCTNENNVKEALIEFRRLSAQSKKPNENGVEIVSVHKSKGLAWPTVIVPGCAEGVFPYKREGEEMSIEAERRLFLVAITRVRKYLVLIGPSDPAFDKIESHLKIDFKRSYTQGPTNISRFMFECNYHIGNIVGQCIAGNMKDLDKARGHKQRGFYNDYLSTVGSNVRL